MGNIPIFSQINEYIENYEKISQDQLNYVSLYGENPFISESLWVEAENDTLNIINKYLMIGDKILDIGVGMGRLLGKIPDNVEKYGMDISAEMLKIASKKNINCCLSLIEDMPYKSKIFDIVICTDVLEHVLDLNLAVSNVLRVLKDDGTFIIRVPYRENLEGYLDDSYPYYYVHVRNFDEHSLKLFFTRVFNCNVIEWQTTGTYLEKTHQKGGNFIHGRILNILSHLYQLYLKGLKNRDFDAYKQHFHKTEIIMALKKINSNSHK